MLSVEPMGWAMGYGSQYPVEDSYHICHQGTNVAKNCLCSSLIGPKRELGTNKRNIGLIRLTPIFAENKKPKEKRGRGEVE